MAEAANIGNKLEPPPLSLAELSITCERLAHAEPGDTRELASLLLQMNLMYYGDVLKQAKQSFRFALMAAGVGVIFFFCAAWAMYKSGVIAWISLVAGALVQVISGTCFYLYAKASSQFATFHI